MTTTPDDLDRLDRAELMRLNLALEAQLVSNRRYWKLRAERAEAELARAKEEFDQDLTSTTEHCDAVTADLNEARAERDALEEEKDGT